MGLSPQLLKLAWLLLVFTWLGANWMHKWHNLRYHGGYNNT